MSIKKFITNHKRAHLIGKTFSRHDWIDPPIDKKNLTKNFYIGVEKKTNKAICLGDDGMRQHILISGEKANTCALSLVRQAMAKDTPLVVFSDKGNMQITDIQDILAITSEYGTKNSLMIFSHDDDRFMPLPKIPMDVYLEQIGILKFYKAFTQTTGYKSYYEEMSGSQDDMSPLKCFENYIYNIGIKENDFQEILRNHSLKEIFEIFEDMEVNSNRRHGYEKERIVFFSMLEDAYNDVIKNNVNWIRAHKILDRVSYNLDRCLPTDKDILNIISDDNENAKKRLNKLFLCNKVVFYNMKPELNAIYMCAFKMYVENILFGFKNNNRDKDLLLDNNTQFNFKNTYRIKTYLFILSHFIPRGFALVSAQARALGVSMVCSIQNLMNDNKLLPVEVQGNAEFESVIANTNTKISANEDVTSLIHCYAIFDIKLPFYKAGNLLPTSQVIPKLVQTYGA